MRSAECPSSDYLHSDSVEKLACSVLVTAIRVGSPTRRSDFTEINPVSSLLRTEEHNTLTLSFDEALDSGSHPSMSYPWLNL